MTDGPGQWRSKAMISDLRGLTATTIVTWRWAVKQDQSNRSWDLNPLHDVISRKDYKEKYYKSLMPLGLKYAEAWLDLMEQASEETSASEIICNCEAQHRYLTWRAEKDPGHRVLKKLIGEAHSKDLVKNFLFNGVDELGSKTFLDYFPEYQCEDGTVNDKRSIIGKSFEHRPWDLEYEIEVKDCEFEEEHYGTPALHAMAGSYRPGS
ncbi:hypothetical protein TEA_015222 [Camellia sinensis var. sinensis]|uniref:Uncharacterized protein n=1 Tax=Camellia sinensis var. sinensis TaxID=542762 RepID=A0A4S4EQA6_CAMSN|nr:hypothetical protein TEA_015222 [Camellia sinensis var. sinensis]